MTSVSNEARIAKRDTTLDPVLSFVIPVFNEEKHIRGTIDAIRTMAAQLPNEIIVVDNESTDRSRQIVTEIGVTCLRASQTIGGIRNLGAAHAKGEILVFVDADVYLQDRWANTIRDVVDALRRNPTMVTGSRCGISQRPSWIERYWMRPSVKRQESAYVNSGHLIIHRSFFDHIGRFREDLETGEDYELCQRAQRAGGTIVDNPDLEVVHEGGPQTLKAFFRRERWHGRGDAISLAAILASKPALLAALHGLMLAVALVNAIVLRSTIPLLLLPAFMVPLWIASSFRRCRSFGPAFWIGIILYAVYFTARGVAIVDVLLGRPSRRRSRVFARSDAVHR